MALGKLAPYIYHACSLQYGFTGNHGADCRLPPQELLKRISGWLKDGGLVFVHIFCHRQLCYHFTVRRSSAVVSFRGHHMCCVPLAQSSLSRAHG